MSVLNSCRCGWVTLITLVSCLVVSASASESRSPLGVAPGEAPSLLRSAPFQDRGDAKAAGLIAPKEFNGVRTRAVAIDFSVLQQVRDARPTVDRPQTIRIPFFDDASLLVEISAAVPTASGGQGYIGRVAGIAQSMVVMVNNEGTISINVSTPNKRFVIHGTDKDGYTALELGPPPITEHGTLTPPEINAPPLPAKASGSTAGDVIEVAADTGAEIDVMVVYTPRTRNTYGGVAQIHAAIDAQILLINQIYANSNVVHRLRLVYKGEVAHTERPGSGNDLGALAATTDGILDEVPALRNLYQADVVTLWGYYPDVCGIGYLMSTESSGFAGNAYNIVNSPACTNANDITMAHELGHNMGLRHDSYVDDNPNTTVTPEGSTTASVITYAHGYVDLANRFRTVMSYNDRCAAAGVNCARIPHFSNPLINYNNSGYYAPAVPAPTGNAANAHESRALNDTRETFANFRQGLTTITGPGIVILSPSSYVVAEGAGSVSIAVQRHRGSTGAISVSYATVGGTAIAGADFTATAGTLTWADGDNSAKTILVNILQDTIAESAKSFTVSLTTPTGGAAIGSVGGVSAIATVRIIDDDSDPAKANCVLTVGTAVPPTAFITPSTAGGDWIVATDRSRTGTCSLKSTPITNLASAETQVSGTFTAGNVSFYYNVSSETNYDCLRFRVDGVQRAELGNCYGGSGVSGEVSAWTLITVPLTAGEHTLVWSYEKDGSAVVGADAAWIDDITLPPPLPPDAFAVCALAAGISAPPTAFAKPATASAGWSIATDRLRSGACSLKSMPMSDDGNALTEVSGTFAAGNVSFYYNVSSEANFDCLRFRVDGVQRAELGNCFSGSGVSGEVPAWTLITVPITAGAHTLAWSYEKDDSISSGADAAWIDDVSIPPFVAATLSIVKAGNGSGTVTGNGIDCGADCTQSVPVGSVVTLTAVPAAGHTFAGWSGGGCSGVGICGVTVNAATTITATFNVITSTPGAPTINAATPGNGQATIHFTAPAVNGGTPITGYIATCGTITGAGTFSPIVVSPLVNNTSYACTVVAVNAVGPSAASASAMVTPVAGAALALASVWSRKNHPGIGEQDIQIDTNAAPGGAVTVEPRAIGTGHLIVFRFNNAITAVGGSATTIGAASHTVGGNEIIIKLTGVADNQRATISLTNVSGPSGMASTTVSIGFLVGDINNSRSVNSSDISAIKARSGQPVAASTFRYDLNASGTINGGDVSMVKARSGMALP